MIKDIDSLRETYLKLGFDKGDPCVNNGCNNQQTIIREGKGHRVLYGGRCLPCIEALETRQAATKIEIFAENQRYLQHKANNEGQ